MILRCGVHFVWLFGSLLRQSNPAGGFGLTCNRKTRNGKKRPFLLSHLIRIDRRLIRLAPSSYLSSSLRYRVGPPWCPSAATRVGREITQKLLMEQVDGISDASRQTTTTRLSFYSTQKETRGLTLFTLCSRLLIWKNPNSSSKNGRPTRKTFHLTWALSFIRPPSLPTL